MTLEFRRAVQEMIDVLALENQSLTALDFPAAIRLLGRKNAAAAALQKLRVVTGDGSREVVRDLVDAVEANRTLLERALAIQGRVIGVLAQAARASSAPARYGARGSLATNRACHAFALSARA